ncbi:MAG TPA: MFS transporter [Actinomycetota bacterium]|jgi:FHS family glucose/mannose:H+ symporter-like MFS transporter|nr:MFS transporter [Actinomycetota bacterium]
MRRPTTVGVLVLAAAVGFLLSLYGPSIPELRAAYGVGGGGSALVLSLHFAGAMTGIGWWGLERRLAPRTWLVVAAVLAAGGAVGIAFAPAWPVVLAAAFGLGVGFGVVVVEINVLFAEAFGERTTAMLNLLGACFGAGAILGPLAVAASGGYRLPFCVGAGAALAALALAGDLPRTARPPAPAGDRPPFAVVWGFVALCALYVGVESGIGGWETTSLRAGGAGQAVAASWTAGYWAAITTGRLLAIPLALRVPAPVLAAGSLLLAAAGLGLAHVPALAPVAYTLAGLALGPVFPTALAWLAQAAPGARGATAIVFAAANLGGVVLPVMIGRLVDLSSPAVIPTAVLVVTLACLGAALLLRRLAGPGGVTAGRGRGLRTAGGRGPWSGRR